MVFPPPDAPLPDAPQNWVDRHAPEGLKPWLRLGRFDRPIGVWLLLLPGWQGIALALANYSTWPRPYDLWLVIAFGLGACLMRAAGCAFNDIVDRDIDRKVARTAARPVASGRISARGAWLFLIACSLTSLGILLTFNGLTIALGFASLALVAAYPFMKRITWWPQAWLGLTFNWGALMGFTAAFTFAAKMAWSHRAAQALGLSAGTDIVVLRTFGDYLPAILLYAGGVFWTLGYDTIYALQDIEDDAMVGVKSSARRLGPRAVSGVALFYTATVAFAVFFGLRAGLGPLFYAGLAAYAAHLAWQVGSLRLGDPAIALTLFKSNREAGLILLVAIALGAIHFA